MSFCTRALVGAFAAQVLLPGAGHAQVPREALAPPYTAADLTALPARDWVTNGGNIYNQRYSSLDQINRSNIDQVKAEWRVSLNGSGMNPGFSQQAQALAYAGVIYVVTGENDVFAVDVETGDFHWVYEADVDYHAASVCCGRLSRGLGLGDGMVFLGQLDGRLIALDQRTGRELWNIEAADPRRGYGITAAPLYYDGKVFVGFSGGEFGVRGRMSAYDAHTGEQVWNFYTIPGPGELGHVTWPQDNDVWMFGGAPVWQTPGVDPDLGLIYFSTGNAGPSMNGAVRPGDNLFTSSILALDVATGEYRWHYQVVRHDIWDFDAPNPTILFDAEFDGIRRKAIAHVAKTGYLYILDRTSGVPLTPVIETPVPQDPVVATAATQPIPLGDPVIRHAIDAVGENFDGVITNGGATFTPYNDQEIGYWRPLSGVSWQPSSYNVANHLMYMCAGDGPGSGQGGDPEGRIGPAEPGGYYVDGRLGGARGMGADVRRTLVAMDLTTHKVAWRRLLDDRCAGTITTAGGLIFAGRYNGELTALDSDTGRRLWTFQTDGGFTTTATTFEHEGTQYLVGLAGGSITGGRPNDGLWLFSLNGRIDTLPPGSGEPPGNGEGGVGLGNQDPIDVARRQLRDSLDYDRQVDLARGAEIYQTVCQACHGENGEGGHEEGAPLSGGLTVLDVVATATAGVAGTAMVSFSSVYSVEELQDVANYILQDVVQ